MTTEETQVAYIIMILENEDKIVNKKSLNYNEISNQGLEFFPHKTLQIIIN